MVFAVSLGISCNETSTAAGLYISAATWGTMIAAGAIVGGVYGIAVGYDMSYNHNSYFTDFDPTNVAGGFKNAL